MADTPIPPTAGYAPAVNLTAVIQRLRTGTISGPIDHNLLIRMGIKESLARRVLHSLRVLRLIETDGSLRDEFKALVKARPDEYEQALAAFLREAYAGVFAILDPAAASPEELRNAFWGYEPRGQIGAMIRLFVGLCEEAGLVAKTEARATRTAQRRPPAPKDGGVDHTPKPPEKPPEKPPHDTPPPPPPPLTAAHEKYVELLLAKAAEQDTPDADLLDRIERALGIATAKESTP